ncbi:hypothetical protein [Roseateles sp.]|uniref:hypothetical protein n=1 Tax=Roseateles sp. TaxID=1971397 RepID=UPI002DFB5080|nr:hypothetical protein [Roseateles sp.]
MPNIQRSLARLALTVASIYSIFPGQTCSAQITVAARAFLDKPLAAEHIHVDTLSHFRRWRLRSVPLGNYDQDAYERTRIGSILIAPGAWAYLDAIWDKVDKPSYFELIDPTSGTLLTKVAVVQLHDAEWYFPGNGVFYLNQSHLGLCGPRHTRQFMLRDKTVRETPQPLAYVGADTDTAANTPLYDLAVGGNVIDTLAAGSKVTVLGVFAESTEPREAPLLVKTPLGLTGWHHRTGQTGDGILTIYQCN